MPMSWRVKTPKTAFIFITVYQYEGYEVPILYQYIIVWLAHYTLVSKMPQLLRYII